jgi:hypothetical protein
MRESQRLLLAMRREDDTAQDKSDCWIGIPEDVLIGPNQFRFLNEVICLRKDWATMGRAPQRPSEQLSLRQVLITRRSLQSPTAFLIQAPVAERPALRSRRRQKTA